MDVSKKDKKLFGSPYVVGIEYMEGMHSFTLEEMRSSPEWKKEYAGQYALSAMFEQDDLVQLTMTADGHICGYDFTETFWLSDMTVRAYQLPRRAVDRDIVNKTSSLSTTRHFFSVCRCSSGKETLRAARGRTRSF